MKRIFIISMMISLSLFTNAQTSISPSFTKDDYLKKSKDQKTMGFILFGGGSALFLTGIIIGNKDDDSGNFGFGQNFEAGIVLAATGIVAGLISIPFFVSSANNAKRAAAISFNFQKIPALQNNALQPTARIQYQPGVTVKVSL